MSDKQTGDIQEKIRGILNTCKYLEQYQIGDVDDAYTVTDHIFDDTKAIKNLSTMLSQELAGLKDELRVGNALTAKFCDRCIDLEHQLAQKDKEWNKYTDMHDDVMLNQIDELKARLKEHKNALEFARGAIGDAIYLEDGLDGDAGEIVIIMITEVLDDKDEYESTFKDGE